MRKITDSRVLSWSLLVTGLWVAAPATAADTTVEEQPAEATDVSPDGIAWGAFLVRPELGVSLLYDSNIYAERDDEVDDTITLVSPSVSLRSQWDKHKLNFNAGTDIARYSDNSAEDYEDYWVDAEGRYDLTTATNVFGGLGYTSDHEDRGSPDDVQGDEPTTFTSLRAHAGVAHSWEGPWSMRAGATFEQLDYDDVGALLNDDRDRDVTGLGLRVTYRLHPRYTLFGQAVYDNRAYDESVDYEGNQRDSDGNRFALGMTGVFSNRLSGSAFLGHLSHSFDDPAFSDVSTLDFGGQLTWRASPTTRVTARVERTLEETTLSDASSYLYTSGSVQALHRIDARWQATAGVSAGRADYQGGGREDDLYSAELGLRYHLSPRVYLATGYRVITRDSNERELVGSDANPQEWEDYARQQVFLTLGTLLYPVRDSQFANVASADALAAAAVDWRGLFVGAQLAHGSSGFHNNGLRDGTTDEGEYADTGKSAGLFAGYGWRFDRWYVGLEAEAESASTTVAHRKAKGNSRELAIERDDGYGYGLRGGYTLAAGDLLYLRFARVRTDFDTYYTIISAPENAVDGTLTLDGTRYGIGADIPAHKNLFVRMDYSHTDYDDLIADLVTEVESFDPSENYFRLGLGWQFGGDQPSLVTRTDIDVRGFYVGANVGHGSLNSHLTGEHYDSGGGPFAFSGDFGHNAGATGGAFAGVGTTWDRWYAGLEATAEASTADWTHIREPGGRNFAVEKKDTYGLGLRGGYVLPSGTLLYVHADRVHTRFNTQWRKGENSTYDIDRDDRIDGSRIGLGAELPASRSLFVRLDYSYTEYDDYGFTTAHGNADTMNFDHSETLFRLGLGVRF